MAEPLQVLSGDTWTWTRSESAYPASTWRLTYYLAKDSSAPTVIQAAADGTEFSVQVLPAETAAMAAGAYHWTARVSDGTNVHTIGFGILTVRPDPSAAADPRPLAERMVAILSSALEAAGSGALIVEYELDGVKVKKDRRSVLFELDRWRSEVRRQRGGPAIVSLPVRFRHD